jgi:hypothetical protein
MAKTLILVGGFYNLAFAVFHLLFWRIFKWNTDLQRVSFLNRAIMQVLNLCLMWVFVIFGYISLFHADELLSSSLGHALLVLMALFWLFRAIEQIIFFHLKSWGSWLFLAIFLVGALLYAFPCFALPAPHSTRTQPALSDFALLSSASLGSRPRPVAGWAG